MARILIVDDDPQSRRIMRIALTVNGHEITEASNGAEALNRIPKSEFDLVLLDWLMPVMGGEETCRAIRAVSEVPVIVVSARDRAKDALAAGAFASLTKPVDIRVLLGCIEVALNHRERA